MFKKEDIGATYSFVIPVPVELILDRFGDRIREVEVEIADGEARSVWRFRIGADAEKGAA